MLLVHDVQDFKCPTKRARHLVKKKCPLCESATVRVDQHLMRIHGMRRGSRRFNEAIDACVVVVAAPDSGTDEFLSEALQLYGDYQRDRSSGVQSERNTVALHRSAIKTFLTVLDAPSLRGLEEIGREGGQVDQLLAAKT